MTGETNIQDKNSATPLNKTEIDLHIAEYNALTSRNDSLMTVNFSQVIVFLAWLTFISDKWYGSKNNLLLWIGLGGAQVLTLLWLMTTQEIYRNVVYMECQLRPLLQKIIKQDNFWGYEKFYAKTKGHPLMWLEKLSFVAYPLAIGAIAFLDRKMWKFGDSAGLVLNVILLVIIAVRVKAILKVKRRYRE